MEKTVHICVVNIEHVPDQPSCYTERAIETGKLANVTSYIRIFNIANAEKVKFIQALFMKLRSRLLWS